MDIKKNIEDLIEYAEQQGADLKTIESIKELKQEVDDLKKEIQELKNGSSK